MSTPPDSITPKSKLAERLANERRALAELTSTDWFIILLALGIGVILVNVAQSTWLKAAHPTIDTICEHVGLGFIVSAMAIFGYEWRSNARKLLPLTESLVRSAKEITKVHDTLIDLHGSKSLEEKLQSMLPEEDGPDHRSELITYIIRLVESVRKLNKVAGWAEHFIAELLNDVVVNNASRLSQLDAGGDHPFEVPPTGATVADLILSAQMRALGQGDSYEVISHLTAWKDGQLSKLQEATSEATSRGASVKRIFNLVRDFRNFGEPVSAENARATLKKHLSYMNDLGPDKYGVKVFFPKDLEKLSEDSYRIDMYAAHFGIFTHQGQRLRVRVNTHDLASMSMSKHQGDFKRQVALFNAAWHAVPNYLSNDVIEQVVQFYSGEKSVGEQSPAAAASAH